MSTTACEYARKFRCFYGDNSTGPLLNNTAPAGQQEPTQAEKNARADTAFIWAIVPVTAVILAIGAYFWIRERRKKHRARKANNATDIELQERAPEPASPEHGPGLFYLNQDQATRMETPPPTYSATTIRNYFKGG